LHFFRTPRIVWDNMNGIFFAVVLISVLVLLIVDPGAALESMLSGGRQALELTLTMTAVYAVWLGLLKIAEDCGLTASLARLLKRPIRLLFGKVSDEAGEYIAMNLSANLLGMGGVATPMGIRAAEELDKAGNVFGMGMLFVLSATSIQLLPTSVIALRAEAGSINPGDIILPTLITTTLSTAAAAAALLILKKRIK